MFPQSLFSLGAGTLFSETTSVAPDLRVHFASDDLLHLPTLLTQSHVPLAHSEPWEEVSLGKKPVWPVLLPLLCYPTITSSLQLHQTTMKMRQDCCLTAAGSCPGRLALEGHPHSTPGTTWHTWLLPCHVPHMAGRQTALGLLQAFLWVTLRQTYSVQPLSPDFLSSLMKMMPWS